MIAYTISDEELDQLQEMVSNDDALTGELVRLRGGCRCHLVHPPCVACCNPLTAEEALYLGIYEEPTPHTGEVQE